MSKIKIINELYNKIEELVKVLNAGVTTWGDKLTHDTEIMLRSRIVAFAIALDLLGLTVDLDVLLSE